MVETEFDILILMSLNVAFRSWVKLIQHVIFKAYKFKTLLYLTIESEKKLVLRYNCNLLNAFLFSEHAVSGLPFNCRFHPWVLSSSGKRRTHRSPDYHLAHFHGVYLECWRHVSRIYWTLFGILFCVLHGSIRSQYRYDCINIASLSYSMQAPSNSQSNNGELILCL